MKPLIGILFFSASYFLLASCSVTQEQSQIDESTAASKSDSTEGPRPERLSEEDLARRTEVEQLMLKGERLHDGALELDTIGDIDSVPALLMVLKEHPPNAKGTMICTTAHALGALRRITGADPGFRHQDWYEWWERHQKTKVATGQ